MEQMESTKEHDDKGSSISQRSVRMSHEQQGSWEQRSIQDRRWQSHRPVMEGKWSLWPLMIQHNHVVFRGIWRIASHFGQDGKMSANVKFVTCKQEAISYFPSSFATWDVYSRPKQPLVKANITNGKKNCNVRTSIAELWHLPLLDIHLTKLCKQERHKMWYHHQSTSFFVEIHSFLFQL